MGLFGKTPQKSPKEQVSLISVKEGSNTLYSVIVTQLPAAPFTDLLSSAAVLEWLHASFHRTVSLLFLPSFVVLL